jgi:hypothetical protein
VSLFALLVGCAQPPPVEGTVHDPWGAPVGDATVVVEGIVERWRTDADGRFLLELGPDAADLIVGKAGYMRATGEVSAGEGARGPVEVELWPDPEQPGFFAVGPRGYVHLATRTVRVLPPARKSTEALPVVAPPALSEDVVPSGISRFVLKSTVPTAQMKGLDLALARLAPVAPKDPRARDSDDSAALRAEGVVPHAMAGMAGKDSWMVTLEAPLAPGVYAWHTAKALDLRDPAALALVPRERMLAWVFAVE